MIVVAATDDQGGMMFNQRRQSQDRVLRAHILALAKDSRLWMNAYTGRQFADSGNQERSPANSENREKSSVSANGGNQTEILVDDAFLEKAGAGEYCFVENSPAAPYESRIEKIVLFKWNRAYPGDFFFDMDLAAWKRIETEDFAGASHEKITQEVYVRE